MYSIFSWLVYSMAINVTRRPPTIFVPRNSHETIMLEMEASLTLVATSLIFFIDLFPAMWISTQTSTEECASFRVRERKIWRRLGALSRNATIHSYEQLYHNGLHIFRISTVHQAGVLAPQTRVTSRIPSVLLSYDESCCVTQAEAFVKAAAECCD